MSATGGSVTNSASVHSTASQHVRIFRLTINHRPQAAVKSACSSIRKATYDRARPGSAPRRPRPAGHKTWTLVVLLSLALGIGANTALFTAVNGLLLQTVNVHEPERLVRFNHAGPNDMVRNSNDYGYSGRSGKRNVRSTFSLPMIEQLRAANTTLTGLAAGVPMGSLNVSLVDGDAQLATGYQATGNYFTVIGVPAVLGRAFGEADDRPSAPPVAVISHAVLEQAVRGRAGRDRPRRVDQRPDGHHRRRDARRLRRHRAARRRRAGRHRAAGVRRPLRAASQGRIPRMQQPTYWWLRNSWAA